MKQINHICIIDDDPIVVFGIRKMLSLIVDCNHISSHCNGKVALDTIKSDFEDKGEIPDVVFLDINMPIMDGWQFLEEFITLPIEERVRVNIVTSSIDPLDIERWESYRQKTKHLITFNNKPIRKEQIGLITEKA